MAKGSVNFLADENISPVLVAILNKLNERCVKSIHRTEYAGMPDEKWLPVVTSRGYICLTCDRKMMLERSIAEVLIAEKATVIFFGEHFSHLKGWDQALWLLKYWHKIKAHAATMKPGELIRVMRNGRILPVACEVPKTTKARRKQPPKLRGLKTAAARQENLQGKLIG